MMKGAWSSSLDMPITFAVEVTSLRNTCFHTTCLGPKLLEFLDICVESAGLFGAARGVVFLAAESYYVLARRSTYRIEVNHYVLLSLKTAQSDCFAVLVLEREVRCSLSDRHHR
jgi:hypothetical protein